MDQSSRSDLRKDAKNLNDRKRKISNWVRKIIQPQNNTHQPVYTAHKPASSGTRPHSNTNNTNTYTNNTLRKPTRYANTTSKESVPKIKSSPVPPTITYEQHLDHPSSPYDRTDVQSNSTLSSHDDDSTADSVDDNVSNTGIISLKTRKSDFSAYSTAAAATIQTQTQTQPPAVSSSVTLALPNHTTTTTSSSSTTGNDNASIKSSTNATITSASETINSSIIGIPPASIVDRNRTTTGNPTTMSMASQSMLNYQPLSTGAASVFSGNVSHQGSASVNPGPHTASTLSTGYSPAVNKASYTQKSSASYTSDKDTLPSFLSNSS